MSLALHLETERLIERHVETGGYSSADEVVRAALELLDRRDQTSAAAIHAAIVVGMDQLRRGECLNGETVFAELLADMEGDAE